MDVCCFLKHGTNLVSNDTNGTLSDISCVTFKQVRPSLLVLPQMAPERKRGRVRRGYLSGRNRVVFATQLLT